MPLYKGNFCWHGEDHTLHTQAKSEAQAFQQLCIQLASRVGYLPSPVTAYFKRSPNKYNIEEVSSNVKA